jgi:hypothetical protein
MKTPFARREMLATVQGGTQTGSWVLEVPGKDTIVSWNIRDRQSAIRIPFIIS